MNGSFKVGDRVRYINARIRTSTCPPVGTVGIIVRIDHDDFVPYLVQWPVGAAIGGSKWWHAKEELEPVEDGDA